jgi:hypothetical protein
MATLFSSSDEECSDSKSDDSNDKLSHSEGTDFIPAYFNSENLLPKPPPKPQPAKDPNSPSQNLSNFFREALEEIEEEEKNPAPTTPTNQCTSVTRPTPPAKTIPQQSALSTPQKSWDTTCT